MVQVRVTLFLTMSSPALLLIPIWVPRASWGLEILPGPFLYLYIHRLRVLFDYVYLLMSSKIALFPFLHLEWRLACFFWQGPQGQYFGPMGHSLLFSCKSTITPGDT